MLQRLKRADRNAKLFSRLEILDGGLQRLVHQADRLGTQRGAGVVDDALDQSEAILGIADRCTPLDLDAGEGDVGGVQAVLGRIALARDALGIGRHEEHTDAGLVALRALGARRHLRVSCRRHVV